MKYLVQPAFRTQTNYPERIYTIVSEHSRLALTLRSEPKWSQVPGGLRQVSVAADGAVWGVNASNEVWRWRNPDWEKMPVLLKQVSVSSRDSVWGINMNGDAAHWNGSFWDYGGRPLASVSAASDGTVWGTDGVDNIFLWRGGVRWEQVPGSLRQLSVGSRTVIWGVNSSKEIFVRKRDHWVKIDGKLTGISVAADGSVWGVASDNGVFRWHGGWVQENIGMRQISVGTASEVWGVTPQDTVLRNTGAGHSTLIQTMWTGDPRQQWRLLPVGDGSVRIENVATGEVLSVYNNETGDHVEIQGWGWQNQHNQQFRFSTDNQGQFHITGRQSGKLLEVAHQSLEAGARVWQSSADGGADQNWWLADVRPTSVIFDPQVRLYEHPNFQGAYQDLGIGAFDGQDLAVVGDRVSSMRIPANVRVTLFEHVGFAGTWRSFTGDVMTVGDMDNRASSVKVEKVATIFENYHYMGRSSLLGVGTYRMSDLGISNDNLSSLRVPHGLVVTLYEHENFEGESRSYTEDCPFVAENFNDRTSSIAVRRLDVVLPRDGIRYGGTIQLRSHHGKWLVSEPDGNLNANRPTAGLGETFTIVRAGPSQHLSHVAYGDIIALRSYLGKYMVENGGQADANSDTIGPMERFLVVRSGTSESGKFVARGDTISLRSSNNYFLVAESDGQVNANRGEIGDWERWNITGYTPPPRHVQGAGVDDEDTGGGPCGANVCAENVCVMDTCGADACGAEACGVDATLYGACKIAASGASVCGVDANAISACWVALSGARACGAAACGVDACAAALAGISACGLEACAADFCGADACGAAACGAAGGVGFCPVDACGAAVCGVDICPVDFCGADACGLNFLPIPGCFLTTACVRARGLPDDCHELNTLRFFRDGYMRASPDGPAMISEYNEIAPRLVAAIERRADARALFDEVYDSISVAVRLIEGERHADALKLYADLVRDLKDRLL